MAYIDFDKVFKKVEVYVKSAKGEKAKADYLDRCQKEGRTRTASGSVLITQAAMREAADLMIKEIQIYGRACYSRDSAKSLKEHFDSLKITKEKFSTKTQSQLFIGFPGEKSLHRNSLYTHGRKSKRRIKYYTGGGIDNIISLFDTGYSAKKRVNGLWEGHLGLGFVKSRKQRVGQRFMSLAVDSFNTVYGEEYHCVASISANEKYYIR